jgi:hypothetical protein
MPAALPSYETGFAEPVSRKENTHGLPGDGHRETLTTLTGSASVLRDRPARSGADDTKMPKIEMKQ